MTSSAEVSESPLPSPLHLVAIQLSLKSGGGAIPALKSHLLLFSGQFVSSKLLEMRIFATRCGKSVTEAETFEALFPSQPDPA